MEWISVEDRLPEENAVVYIHRGDLFPPCAGKMQRLTRHVGEGAPVDVRWFAVPGWGHELHPTHWMELPESPK